MDEIVFHSKRLNFRLFTPKDAHLVYQLNSDAAVLRYLHELPATPDKAKYTLENSILSHYTAHGYGRWALYLKSTNDFIGWCGLKYRPEIKVTDLGYRLLQRFWHQGYGTEAARASLHYGFTQLGLQNIVATAHVDNAPSINILKSCGMRYLRNDIVDNCPVQVFEITAGEYASTPLLRG